MEKSVGAVYAALLTENITESIAESEVPAKIMLLPPGFVKGRDGRVWQNNTPETIIRHFRERECDLPIDIEHSSEHKAPKGEAAPAVGWITAIENRAGEIWADVVWTARGRDLIAERSYRYISPVILYNTAREVVGITSAGLTNQPNLKLAALNREGKEMQQNNREKAMQGILQTLNLPETATEAEAMAAITALQNGIETAKNRADNPELSKFVPRADYDSLVQRAKNAEEKLAEVETAQREEKIAAAIAAALKEGKITPATKEYHTAQCRQEGGLERFAEFVKAAPVIAPASEAFSKKPGEEQRALNAEEKQIAEALGLSEEEFLQTEKEAA